MILKQCSLVALLSLHACTKSESSPKAAPAPTAAPAATPDEEVIAPATAGANVSGAFLTVDCSSFESISALANLSSDSETLGCLYKAKADQTRLAVPPEGEVLEVELDDGTKLLPEILPTGEAVGWHFGFNLKKAERDRVKSVTVRARDPQGGALAAETKALDYDYTKDPAFGVDAIEWIELAGEVLFEMFREKSPGCVPSPAFPVEGIPVGRVWPLPDDFLAQDFHLAFVTQQRQRSGGGVAAFDRACQEAGDRLAKNRSWRAVVSTSAAAASDRIKVTKPVFNSVGFVVARDADEFWNLDRFADRYGETGKADVERQNRYEQFKVPDAVEDRGSWHNSLQSECALQFRQAYLGIADNSGSPLGPVYTSGWTGSLPGGVPNVAAGTCEDWTSASKDVKGGVGRSYAADQTVFARLSSDPAEPNDDFERCSLRGFVLCISQ